MRPADVGARVELRVGEMRLGATVSSAFHPEPRFSPDRVLRGEVYERPWATLDMGTIPLEEGPADLRLHLVSLEGQRGPEVKAVRLSWVEE